MPEHLSNHGEQRLTPMLEPIRLGMALFTLVEPHRGHEVAYNRWYERDHFYAGCMIGASCFAGKRFVATRDEKSLRYPADSPITPSPEVGSYLAVSWVLAGRENEWNRWAVDQVNALHANGRMFPERDHIHTLLYDFDWAAAAGSHRVPVELALDHPYRGLVAVIGEALDVDKRAELDEWVRSSEGLVGAPPVPDALCAAFRPRPLLGHAPSDVPREPGNDKRFLHLWFVEEDPKGVWPGFAKLGERIASTGLGKVLWVSPFVPTLPGTDDYTDRLW
jgi:hypothetical protein